MYRPGGGGGRGEEIKLIHWENNNNKGEERGGEGRTLGEDVFNFSVIQMLQVNRGERVCKKVKAVSGDIYGAVQRARQTGGNRV